MRYLAAGLFIVITMMACKESVKGRNGEVYKSAVQYNDYIVDRQTIVVKDIMEFSRVSAIDLDSAYLLLEKYEEKTDHTIRELEGMPAYKGDSSFRDAGVKLFNFYKKIFGGPYKELVNIRRSPDGVTEEGEARLQQIIDDLTKEEEKYDKIFYNAQQQFSKNNNMKMKKNEMQEKIDDINK